MLKLSQLKTDPKKDREGVWFDYGAGVRVKVARWMNPAHRDAVMEAASRRGPRAIASDDEVKKLAIRNVCDHVLVDWDGVADESGKATPYSADVAAEFFAQPGTDSFFEFVTRCAMDIESFRATDDAAVLGNSSPGSNGSSSSGNSKNSSPSA